MKNLLILFLFATGYCCAQSDTKIAFDSFKRELEAYQSNPANAKLKPADCKEYKLLYIVKGSSFEEIIVPANSNSLCEDLGKYDTSKHPAPAGQSYDIKAVGNTYYIIRVDENEGKVMQTWYYYERRK